MGIKMYEAIYNNKIIKLSQYKDEMKGKIFCKYCNVPITYTTAYIKNIGECEVKVPSYFRLINKNIYPHNIDKCKYVTENIIKDIYAESSSDKDLMTKDGEEYIVRLHILIDTMEVEIKQGEKDDNIKKKNRSTLNYIKAGERPTYITTLRKIMRLRYEVEEKSEVKKYLKLSFYNNKLQKYDKVLWENFFIEYDKDSYLYAYQYIKANTIYHPICFCGRVKEICKPTEKFKWYKLKIYSIKIEENKYISLDILFNNFTLYEELKRFKDKDIIVYGSNAYATEPRFSKTKENEKEKMEFNNINVRIYDSNQIMCIDNWQAC